MLPAWIKWRHLVIRQGKRKRTGSWIRRGGFQVETSCRHLFGVTCGQAFSGVLVRTEDCKFYQRPAAKCFQASRARKCPGAGVD